MQITRPLKKLLFRRPMIREYPYEVKQFELTREGIVEYAQWTHPQEVNKQITQAMVDGLRQFIKPGDLVIDIGAHTGDTSVPMALATGPTGITLALEPNPYVYKILDVNAQLNPQTTNIVPLNFAVTDEDGEFVFHYSDEAFCNGGYLSSIKKKRHDHRHKLNVKGVNFVNYLQEHYAEALEKLAYIKIDTEGYDKEIIAQLMPVLKKYQPILVTEVYQRLTKPERLETYHYLQEAGYECAKYEGPENPFGEPVDENQLMRWKHFDIIAFTQN